MSSQRRGAHQHVRAASSEQTKEQRPTTASVAWSVPPCHVTGRSRDARQHVPAGICWRSRSFALEPRSLEVHSHPGYPSQHKTSTSTTSVLKHLDQTTLFDPNFAFNPASARNTLTFLPLTMKFYSQSHVYEYASFPAFLTYSVLTARPQRPVVDCFLGLLPPLSESVCCSRRLLRRHLSYADTSWHLTHDAPHPQTRGAPPLGASGNCLQGGELDSRGERGRPHRPRCQLQDPELGPRKDHVCPGGDHASVHRGWVSIPLLSSPFFLLHCLRPALTTSYRRTIHTSTVNIHSRFGWGLTSRIEEHGVSKFQANLQKSRQGLSVILALLRQQPMALGLSGSLSSSSDAWYARQAHNATRTTDEGGEQVTNQAPGRWAALKRWVRAGE
jgi:hypothetical protein